MSAVTNRTAMAARLAVDAAARESLNADYERLFPLNHELGIVEVEIDCLKTIRVFLNNDYDFDEQTKRASNHHLWPTISRLNRSDPAFPGKLNVKMVEVEQELESFLESRENLWKTVATLWSHVNETSRPFLRHHHILELPHEILVNIFKAIDHTDDLSVPFFEIKKARTNTIKRSRLTCRQFYHASSQFLVPRVYLDYSADSISRLEGISRHPVMSKAVHTVEFRLSAYNETIAGDYAIFVAFSMNKLISKLEDVPPPEESQETTQMAAVGSRPGLSWELNESSLERVDEAKKIVGYWGWLVNAPGAIPDPDPAEIEMHDRLLRKAHQGYRERYLQKMSSMDREDFLRAAGTAIARMPCLKTLKFSEDSSDRYSVPGDFRSRIELYLFYSDFTVSDILYDQLLELSSGYELARSYIVSDMTCFIPRLVAEVSTARAEFKTGPLEILGLYLNSIDVSELLLEPTIWTGFVSEVKNLKQFSFRCPGRNFSSQHNTNLLNRFLQPCLASPRLQKIWVMLNDNQSPSIDLAPALLSRGSYWPDLIDLELRGVAFELSTINKLLARLPSSRPITISLDSPTLLSGTWASASESFRATRKRNGGKFWLHHPAGAECDDLTWYRYATRCDPYKEEQSRIDRFIQGKWQLNIRDQSPVEDDDDFPNPFLVDMDTLLGDVDGENDGDLDEDG